MNHEICYPESEITQTNRQLTQVGADVQKILKHEPNVIKKLREEDYNTIDLNVSSPISKDLNQI